MTKLTERSRVKDFAQIPRADTLQDALINAMIEQASAEVEDITRRKFEKKERVEYHTSYEQAAFDPEPQIVLLDAFPVDMEQQFILKWSAYDHRENLTITLNPDEDEFGVEEEKGFIWVRSAGGIAQNLPLLGATWITYAPRGFQVTYTGGYSVTEAPEGHTADPLDDFGVAQVPEGLKNIIAQKIARDLKEVRYLLPFSDNEKKLLKPWQKKDLI